MQVEGLQENLRLGENLSLDKALRLDIANSRISVASTIMGSSKSTSGVPAVSDTKSAVIPAAEASKQVHQIATPFCLLTVATIVINPWWSGDEAEGLW
jgi:hypothetical protein